MSTIEAPIGVRDLEKPKYSLTSGAIVLPIPKAIYEQESTRLITTHYTDDELPRNLSDLLDPRELERKARAATKDNDLDTIIKISGTHPSYYDWKNTGNLMVHEKLHFYQHIFSLELIFNGFLRQIKAAVFLDYVKETVRSGTSINIPLTLEFSFPEGVNGPRLGRSHDQLSPESLAVYEGLAIYYQSMYEVPQYSQEFVEKVLSFIGKYSLGKGLYHSGFEALRKNLGLDAYWVFPVISWASLYMYYNRDLSTFSVGQKFSLISSLICESRDGRAVANAARATSLQGPLALSVLFDILKIVGIEPMTMSQTLSLVSKIPTLSRALCYPMKYYLDRMQALALPIGSYLMDITKWEEEPGSLDIIGRPTLVFSDEVVFGAFDYGAVKMPGISLKASLLAGDAGEFMVSYYKKLISDFAALGKEANGRPFDLEGSKKAILAQKSLIFAEDLFALCSNKEIYTSFLREGKIFRSLNEGSLEEFGTPIDAFEISIPASTKKVTLEIPGDYKNGHLFNDQN